MDETIQRILTLIDNSGLTDKQILKELDVSNTSTLITDWRTGRSKSPQIKHIIKLADFFQVTTDFLLVGVEKYDKLSSDEIAWLNLYKQLSSSDDNIRNECIGFVKGYIAREKSCCNENK